MNGNSHVRVIATPRDLHILSELGEAKILDREQIQIVAGFRRINRANDRLSQLHAARLICRRFLGTPAAGRKAIYSLSARGARLIGRDKFWRFQGAEDELLIGDSFTAHQTAVNWVWIGAKYRCAPNTEFLRWVNFQEQLTPALALIPDGYFEIRRGGDVFAHFVEADLGTESQKAWEHKTGQYLKLAASGEFARLFHRDRFRVLVTAPSMRRLENIRATVRKQTSKIFFFMDHKTIYRDGIFTPLWLRPEGEVRQSLL